MKMENSLSTHTFDETRKMKRFRISLFYGYEGWSDDGTSNEIEWMSEENPAVREFSIKRKAISRNFHFSSLLAHYTHYFILFHYFFYEKELTFYSQNSFFITNLSFFNLCFLNLFLHLFFVWQNKKSFEIKN
jgi:hypothetical protein